MHNSGLGYRPPDIHSYYKVLDFINHKILTGGSIGGIYYINGCSLKTNNKERSLSFCVTKHKINGGMLRSDENDLLAPYSVLSEDEIIIDRLDFETAQDLLDIWDRTDIPENEREKIQRQIIEQRRDNPFKSSDDIIFDVLGETRTTFLDKSSAYKGDAEWRHQQDRDMMHRLQEEDDVYWETIRDENYKKYKEEIKNLPPPPHYPPQLKYKPFKSTNKRASEYKIRKLSEKHIELQQNKKEHMENMAHINPNIIKAVQVMGNRRNAKKILSSRAENAKKQISNLVENEKNIIIPHGANQSEAEQKQQFDEYINKYTLPPAPLISKGQSSKFRDANINKYTLPPAPLISKGQSSKFRDAKIDKMRHYTYANIQLTESNIRRLNKIQNRTDEQDEELKNEKIHLNYLENISKDKPIMGIPTDEDIEKIRIKSNVDKPNEYNNLVSNENREWYAGIGKRWREEGTLGNIPVKTKTGLKYMPIETLTEPDLNKLNNAVRDYATNAIYSSHYPEALKTAGIQKMWDAHNFFKKDIKELKTIEILPQYDEYAKYLKELVNTGTQYSRGYDWEDYSIANNLINEAKRQHMGKKDIDKLVLIKRVSDGIQDPVTNQMYAESVNPLNRMPINQANTDVEKAIHKKLDYFVIDALSKNTAGELKSLGQNYKTLAHEYYSNLADFAQLISYYNEGGMQMPINEKLTKIENDKILDSVITKGLIKTFNEYEISGKDKDIQLGIPLTVTKISGIGNDFRQYVKLVNGEYKISSIKYDPSNVEILAHKMLDYIVLFDLPDGVYYYNPLTDRDLIVNSAGEMTVPYPQLGKNFIIPVYKLTYLKAH